MEIRRHVPSLLLALGAAAVLVATPLVLTYGEPGTELPWLLSMAVFLAAAAYTWWRLPYHPVAWWFAVVAGTAGLVQGMDGLAMAVVHGGEGSLQGASEAHRLAWIMLTQQMGIVAAAAAIAHLLGLFPDGRVSGTTERRALGVVWWLLVFPPLVLFARPTLLLPGYYELPEVANPYAVDGLAWLGEVAAVATTASQAGFVVGVVLLVRRYRRTGLEPRRRIRWLLLPAILAVFAVSFDLLLDGPALLMTALWISTMIGLPLVIAVALVRPDLLDVDRVLRRSLVYGLLWLLIAVAYVAAAAGLGVAAGQRFSIGAAITLTVIATLVFQPARQRLERLADRWVFGAPTDPTHVISRLGSALEQTIDLDRLLPRMAETLQEGLGLRWARVRLEPAPPIGDEDPELTVPIVLDDQRLGVVECGPKASGPFTPADEAVVTTLARQAALAVRNVRLTAELERSRTRLVRAQEAERRRIERNIHDGVQQDLVALMATAARTRRQLERDPRTGARALEDLQAGLRRVITELRELAHGIHPSLLSDRGLLEAVEALAARSSVPVSVRADPELRGQRFAQEVEGAGYFAVSEALANVSKHAAARHAQISLARNNGSLLIAVRDDGTGFELANVHGDGLANLGERLAAVGGRLEVVTRPGAGTTVTAELRIVDG